MMVTQLQCEDCDTFVDAITWNNGNLRCECGGELNPAGKVGCVYSSGNDIRPEARELVEKWRDDAELFLDPDDENVSPSERGAATQQMSCADQIEELIEGER